MLQMAGEKRDLALLNRSIDSKRRDFDVDHRTHYTYLRGRNTGCTRVPPDAMQRNRTSVSPLAHGRDPRCGMTSIPSTADPGRHFAQSWEKQSYCC
jgi:hypothetical protein